MRSKTKKFLLLSAIGILILSTSCIHEASAGLVLVDKPYGKHFNFHSKDDFLKVKIKELIKCIEPSQDDSANNPGKYSKADNPLKISSEGSPNGKNRFVFEYIGDRNYNETCLGDSYKRDFIRRLYDAGCMEYVDKINFLNAISCNANQNLECRQVGVEKNRQFAEQATPIMRCLCPDYSKSQAHLSDSTKGFFCHKTKMCVVRTGQICTIRPKALDARLTWNDFDYDEKGDGTAEGIDVADLRPMKKTYPCVSNSFCYVNDTKGLDIPVYLRTRCVCEPGFFSGYDRQCHKGRESPSWQGMALSVAMYLIAIITFFLVLLY